MRRSVRPWPRSGSPRSTPGCGPTVEVVRPPSDASAAIAAAGPDDAGVVRLQPVAHPPDRPLALRSRADDGARARAPTDRTLTPEVTVRLDQRAADSVLAELLGISGPTAATRLTGTATAAGWAAADGDPSTAWTTPFSAAVGATLELTNDAETDAHRAHPARPASTPRSLPSGCTPAARRRTSPSRRPIPPARASSSSRHRCRPARCSWRSRRSTRASSSTAATPSRSSSPPASARCPSAPGPPFPNDSTRGAAATSSTIDGEPWRSASRRRSPTCWRATPSTRRPAGRASCRWPPATIG